jgi:hypothetical protein
MEVKNKKQYYKPIKKINDNNVIIMWDYKPILKENRKGEMIETPLAVWQEHKFNHVPSLDEIKEIILGYYNQITDEKILTGLKWKNMEIWLSTENQFNYKSAYDLAVQTNGSILPLKFKFNDTDNTIYYTFTDMEDFADFYLTAIRHIQKCLEDGWDKKDSINWEDFMNF